MSDTTDIMQAVGVLIVGAVGGTYRLTENAWDSLNLESRVTQLYGDAWAVELGDHRIRTETLTFVAEVILPGETAEDAREVVDAVRTAFATDPTLGGLVSWAWDAEAAQTAPNEQDEDGEATRAQVFAISAERTRG